MGYLNMLYIMLENKKDSACSHGVNQYNLCCAVAYDHEVSGPESVTDYWEAGTLKWYALEGVFVASMTGRCAS